MPLLQLSPAHLLSPRAVLSMAIGASIGLVLIGIFLAGVQQPDPAWSRWWMLRPLLVVPAAGALAGLFYHSVQPQRFGSFGGRLLAWLVCLLVLLIGLWMGAVVGLDGTLWN